MELSTGTLRAAVSLLMLLWTGLAVACSGDVRERSGEVYNGVDEGTKAAFELELRRTVEAEFGEVVDMAPGGGGTLYVADGMTAEIQEFDGNGVLVRTVGGVGQGPGEFRSLASIAWTDGRLAALDTRSFRITVFDRSGSLVTTHSWQGRAGSELFSAGSALYGRAVVPPALGGPVSDRPTPAVYFYQVTETDLDQLPPISGSPVAWPVGVDCETPDGWIHPLPHPFGQNQWGPLTGFLPFGKLVIADRDNWRITTMDVASGDLEDVKERDVQRVVLSDARWEELGTVQWQSQLTQERGRLHIPGDPSESCPPNEFRPEFFAPIRAVVTDEQGWIWVDFPTDEGFSLGAFDAGGQWVGEAPMPERDVRVRPYIHERQLYVVRVHEHEVQYIEVYDIIGA